MRFEDFLITLGFASALTVAALMVRAYRGPLSRALRWLGDVLGRFQLRHAAFAALAAVLLYTFLDWRAYRDGYFFLALAATVGVGFTVLWCREVLFLMALRDDDLPGRFDKPIWALLLVALPPVGLLLFRTHRLAHWPEPEPKPRATPAARELA